MRPPHRREILAGSLAAAVTAAWPKSTTRADDAPTPHLDDALQPPGGVVDVNVWLGRWPFRRVPGDDPATLVPLLRRHHITEAWTGTLEGPFQTDLTAANARLAESCRGAKGIRLIPFGSINPTLPDWEHDLQQAHESHAMPGIRLHPNYHGYALDAPAVGPLLDAAARRNLLVQIVATMEDPRQQNAIARVPEVDLAPLPDLLARHPATRVMLLNGLRNSANPHVLKALATDRLWLDIATLDAMERLASLLQIAPPYRLLFGSFAPMYYIASTLLKLPESALNPTDTARVLRESSQALLPRS